MKTTELTKTEKQEINGGNTSNSTAIGLNLATDSLLSLNWSWKSGDRQGSHSLELAKGVNIGVGGNNAQAEGN